MDGSQSDSERTGAAAAATTWDVSTLRTCETMARSRLLNCPTCGIAFAMPELFHLFKTHEKQAVFCPSGHAFTPIDPNENPADAATQCLVLAAELLSVRQRLILAEREVARLRPFEKPASPISDDEFKRRCNILAARAEPVQSAYGKLVCGFCGKTHKGDKNLRNHLMRVHRPDVEDLSPHLFE